MFATILVVKRLVLRRHVTGHVTRIARIRHAVSYRERRLRFATHRGAIFIWRRESIPERQCHGRVPEVQRSTIVIVSGCGLKITAHCMQLNDRTRRNKHQPNERKRTHSPSLREPNGTFFRALFTTAKLRCSDVFILSGATCLYTNAAFRTSLISHSSRWKILRRTDNFFDKSFFQRQQSKRRRFELFNSEDRE
jgi:hypothetical protein